MALLTLDEQREVRDYIQALEYTLNEVDQLARRTAQIEEQSRILKKHISILIAHKPHTLIRLLTEDPPAPTPTLHNLNLTRKPSDLATQGYETQPYMRYYSGTDNTAPNPGTNNNPST